ncbi:YbdK family carboxylate-amine ligase [Tepidimonas aquatica]|uniref:Putative glutamate--cysteine ligase 2 n=1 Tax=Tepidimonas aquatica TaxID=247482 RepID=A0A554WEM8_9BURK|nr:YbdK family carboxylate-amine ligase [Tepidimonas aquatica]TSE22043.1 putative glutamate--cysteine ligase 2 [Tepidimonas aquatica]
MPLEPFKHSEPLTMGVELELQIVNPYDLDLTPGADDLLALLRRAPFPGSVTPEMTQSMIEIATGVHTRHEELLAQLRAVRDTLVAAADRLNVELAGGGTHPFQRWFEQRIFDKPRFQQLSGLYGYLAKQFTVFGQHVHIGCRSADEALFLLHALNRYVPHFIALSASSPFFQGVDTLFDSARLNAVFAFPLSGRAPFVLRWDDFEQGYFRKMEATGVVKSMKDFYWDIRPKPEYGTIELRVCDTPLTVGRAAALAAYLQALCRHLLEGGDPAPEEDDYLVYTYNRFQACRFGLDGTMVHPRTREALSIREDVLTTVRRLAPHTQALGSEAALVEIEQVAAKLGNHASHLRAVHARTGNIQGVVRAAADAWRHGVLC